MVRGHLIFLVSAAHSGVIVGPPNQPCLALSGNHDAKAGGRLDHGENYTKSNQTIHRLKYQLSPL